MTIAVDFDGTIVEHEYPQIGKPIPFAVETLKQLHKDGHTLILWTVREGRLLQEAVDYCVKNGITLYAANKNNPEEDASKAPRKLSVDMFIDDRNLGGIPDWGVIYNTIKSMESGRNISFENIMMATTADRRYRRKKNFLIRLGEMFEKDY